MKNHNQPIVTSNYTLLGELQDAPCVWLVRDARNGELCLLQRLQNPSGALLNLLQSGDPELPVWLDGWRHGQEIYLVFQRTRGHGLDELHRYPVGHRFQLHVTSIVNKLSKAGVSFFHENAFCLTEEGGLKLRWFPTSQGRCRADFILPGGGLPSAGLSNWFQRLLGLISRPRAAA